MSSLSLSNLVEGRRVLHFAPEPMVSTFLAASAANYVTADFGRKDVDLQVDLGCMDRIADYSFDLVVACDVLEHVPDDAAALQEIRRVLSVGGWVILTVPQKDTLLTTYEDPSLTTPEERRQAFGQEDHVRMYGEDFGRILENQGFVVTIVDAASFTTEIVETNVLFPPVLSAHPLATNHRRVYFGQKLHTQPVELAGCYRFGAR
jgi:SAM-dependent methyltransferase